MKSIISFLIIILIVSCKQKETVAEEQTQTQKISKVEKNILKDFTHEDIARYTMACVMGQSPKIIKATKNKELYLVSYIRESDNQKFEYKVKFNENKILWADINGRWRNSEYDEKITFVENDNKISIVQTYSDGSADIQEFTKGN